MAKARVIIGLDRQASTAHNARIIVQERLADMYSYTKYIGHYRYARELHDLRIATKRVRYTLEVFTEFLPQESAEFAEELAILQDELGALHDSEVMLTLLRLPLETEKVEKAVPLVNLSLEEGQKPLPLPAASQALCRAEKAPTARERQGLASFLIRQEQRREQCYFTFRRHWDQLEQNHFREKILSMLSQQTEKEDT